VIGRTVVLQIHLATNALRRKFDIATYVSYVIFAAIAMVVVLFLRHSVLTAIVAGMAWGAAPQGLAWGVADAIAPGWVIRWRQRLIADAGDIRKPVGDYFSDMLAVTGDEPWTSRKARFRIRVLGVGLTAFWVVWTALLVWVLPFADTLWTNVIPPR